MGRLSVAMVSKGYPPWIGGVETHLAQLSSRLAATGQVDVRVIVGQEQRAPFIDETIDGVRVQRAATLARIARTPIALGLARLFREPAPDLYHFHSPFPWGEVAGVRARLRQPIIVTWYHDVVRQTVLRRFYWPFMERLLARAARIVVWSAQAAARSSMLQRHAAKTVVIPGAIDTAPFTPTPQSQAKAAALRASWNANGVIVLFVGRLVYYKGVDILLRAMAKTEGTLVIVGAGPLERQLRALANSLGITDRVRFLTSVARIDLPLYYQATDLLVLPSTEPTESFGLVQLEAHASGIPSVCTQLGTGTTAVNRHNETGLVVSPRNVDALADAIRRLAGDRALRERLGRHAQQRAVAEFDIGLCAHRMLGLYREVLNR